jgi:hypothetical protein
MKSESDLQNMRTRVAEAIAQLNRSDRGRVAAARFYEFLNADGGDALGLDSENWCAVETLVRGCRLRIGPEIRDALSKYL